MFVGIDLGTSGVKALLIGEDQSIIGSANGPLEVSRPAPGWSEQAPEDWLTATSTALGQLAAEHNLSGVEGIGLSGQMHGATLLDAEDRVLRPAILWNDTRSHAEASALDADPKFRGETGNIVFPGFTAPKLVWTRNHEPDLFGRVAKVLLPKDYLRLWLTGEYVSEMSDASGTSWFNPSTRDWSDALLAATDLSRENMPKLVEGSAVSGFLKADIASEFGMRSGIPVAGGGGDNAASAVGLGVSQPGEAFLSLGTSGVLFSASDGYAPAPGTALHTFCHALPDRWHQMGVILSATDALAWFARLSGASPSVLTKDLGDLLAPGRTMFLPYLGGERTPHNDAKVRGSFVGLEHTTDLAAATRAVLEGVAFAFRDSLEAMRATGKAPSQLVAVGGGSRSEAWLKILATTLGLPIAVPADGDFGAAFGAARLGMIAVGARRAEALTPPSIRKTIEPEPSLTELFQSAYDRYRSLYIALKELS